MARAKPSKGKTPTMAHGSGAPVASGAGRDPGVDQLGEVLTTWGAVSAFTIDEHRMLIKLNISALSRMLVAVAVDAPHFKSCVSLTMMAYNNGEALSVRYQDLTNVIQGVPVVMGGLEFGLGSDAFAIDDWPVTHQR